MKLLLNKKNFIYLFLCFCIFLLVLFIDVFYMANKKGLHVDESLSFINAQSPSIYNDINIEIPSGVYYGSTIKSLFMYDDNSPSAVKKDIKRMIKYGVNGGHPVPYFILLRACSTGYKLFNVSSFAIVGVTLNFVFLTIAYIFICMLMAKFFESNYLRITGVIVAFLNTATISNVIFIRFYCMQMMFFCIISYYFVCLMKEKYAGKNILTLKKILIYSCLSALTLTGGYFGFVYIFILALILFIDKNIIVLLKNKLFYIAILFVFLFISIISKGFWTNIFTRFDTKTLILRNFIPSNAIYNLSEIIQNGSHDILFYYFYTPVLIMFAYILFRLVQENGLKIKIFELFGKEENLPLLLFSLTLLWACFILWISNVKTVRYYFAVYPVMSVIFPYLCTLRKSSAKKIATIFIAIYLLGAIFPKNFIDAPFAYSKVNYLFKEQQELFAYISSDDVPIYIDEDFFKRNDLHIFRHFLPIYLKDNEKYNINIPQNRLPKHYYMLYTVHKNNDPYVFAAEVLNGKLIKTIEF